MYIFFLVLVFLIELNIGITHLFSPGTFWEQNFFTEYGKLMDYDHTA